MKLNTAKGLNVKIFSEYSEDTHSIQTDINKWLKDNSDIEIKYTNICATGTDYLSGRTVIVLVWYKEQVKKSKGEKE